MKQNASQMNGHAATEFRLSHELGGSMLSLQHVLLAIEEHADVRDFRIYIYGEGEGAPQHRDELPAQVDGRIFISMSTRLRCSSSKPPTAGECTK